MHRRNMLKSAAAVVGAELIAAESAAASTTAPQTSFIETRDRTQLFYKDWGTGKPVVFVHSWAFNSDMWQYQMNYLAGQDLRCIAYDRRGHGRSSQPGNGYDYGTLADDLAALLKHLDLREVTLVGHSMAGGEIIRYLTRHGSGRISKIVLLAATLPFPLKTADNPHGVDQKLFEQLRAALSKDSPRWFAAGAPGFFGVGVPGNSVSPEMIQWGLSLCQQTSLKAIIECNRALAETDFRAELPKIAVPTLIIHGDADQSAPLPLTGRKTAALIPGSQLKVYEGGPHGLFVTHMDRLTADILEFVRT